jgi:hypothetical protein
MDVQVNHLAVLLAALSSMVVGSVWYARGVFGAAWMKMAKVDEKRAKEGAPLALTVAFLSSLVMAYVLAHVTYLSNNFYNNSFLQDALMTGLWMWVGFQGTRILMHDLFEGRRKKLSLMNAGNELVTILVMALIIGLMKV